MDRIAGKAGRRTYLQMCEPAARALMPLESHNEDDLSAHVALGLCDVLETTDALLGITAGEQHEKLQDFAGMLATMLHAAIVDAGRPPKPRSHPKRKNK